MKGHLSKKSCTKLSVLAAIGLSLSGCWGTDPPEAAQGAQVSDDQTTALQEIARLMSGGKSYGGLVADLDLELKTPAALRFKSIVEKAARDELEFERSMAELDVDEVLSATSMSTYAGRNESIASIEALGKLHHDRTFKGSESTLQAVQFFVEMGAVLEFDPVEVLQSDIDALSDYLEAMVQAFGQVVVVCNEGGAKLEAGTLMFRDTSMVQRYEKAVADASYAETAHQTAYQAVLTARQQMIDTALNKAHEALQPPEEDARQ